MKRVESAGEEDALLGRPADGDVERGSGDDDDARSADGASAAAEKSRRAGLLAALLYGCTSITITFFNKAVFFVWHFDFPVTISMLQVLMSLGLFAAMHVHGTISLPSLSAKAMWQAAPLAIFWCLNVLSGIFTLQYMSIPMFSTLRRLTTLIVLIGEHVLLRRYATRPIWMAVIVMTLGALVAGISDLDFNPMGYMCVTINNVCTAAYLLLIQITKRDLQVSNLQLLFLMNLCSLPFLVTAFLAFDAQQVWAYPHLHNFAFILVLVSSCVQVRADERARRAPPRTAAHRRGAPPRRRALRLGARVRPLTAMRARARARPSAVRPPQAFVLNYATFLCTTLNSGVTTSITGQMSKLVTMTVGLFLFVNTTYTYTNLAGLFIGLISSFWYAYIKFRDGSGGG
jgi:solute carrier family 35 protein